ncbi:MAG: hypothetical protein ACI86M_002917 [Saprospiraceae bacterium]|jgi:hypothetical protein
MHVPSSYLDYFELSDVKNNTGNWELLLEEKVDLLPQALSKQLVVLDGFCNEVSVLSHSFSLKPIYLVIRRRRWKPKGGGKHYSNQYNFHSDGPKLTQEFVDYLKAIN